MPDLYSAHYNPDVLSCLANLSNDEVFTPPQIANAMLDLLPQELFRAPSTKFLDPAAKTGVFLREIARRLIVGLADQIPDLQERLDHIFHEQIFGIAMTEITSLLSRRSLYCSKYPNGRYSVTPFDSVQGNVRFKNTQHRWKNGRCVFCGASDYYQRDDGLETHAYEFIHTIHPEEIWNMKFDVIIGNPPYQLSTGGGKDRDEATAAKQAKPLYHRFVEQAKKMNPKYISMIIPARWYAGGIGLSDFRQNMLNDPHLTVLVDYPNSKDCFQGVDIAGGVCFFLWERDKADAKCKVINIIGDDMDEMDRPLNEYSDLFIRSNISISIVEKVKQKASHFVSDMVSAIDTFGISSKEKGHKERQDGDLVLIHSVGPNSQGTSFIQRDKIKKNVDLIDKYKIKISIMVPQNGEVGIDPSKGYRSISTPQILKPGEVDTFSYLNIGFFDTENEAINFRDYMTCKFTRFMMRTTYSSVHISKQNFMFVPMMDFSRAWTDVDLYEWFALTADEIGLIERTMRPLIITGVSNEM